MSRSRACKRNNNNNSSSTSSSSAAASASNDNFFVCDESLPELDEVCSKEELRVNAFTKLHGVACVGLLNNATLQELAGLCSKSCKQENSSLEIIPKSHDDAQLRPANHTIGERSCVCGALCVANLLATMRYGENTRHSFTCVEYLTPTRLKAFKAGDGLPQRPGKCLLCLRYFTNFLYNLARIDPIFLDNSKTFQLQPFENCVIH